MTLTLDYTRNHLRIEFRAAALGYSFTAMSYKGVRVGTLLGAWGLGLYRGYIGIMEKKMEATI